MLKHPSSKKNIKIFAETQDSINATIKELKEDLGNPGITLWIWGWAIFSIMSYEIIEHLLKQWIKIHDIVGNSWGALVGALVATHNIKKEYIDTIFKNISLKPTQYLKVPHIVAGLMTPFLCEFSYEGISIDIKDILIKHTDELVQQFSRIKIIKNGHVDEDAIKTVIINVIAKENIFPNNDKKTIERNLKIHKETFNDIKHKYGVDFKVISSVIKGKNILKEKAKLLEDITFTGNFPVIDSLLVSSNFLPTTLKVKWKNVRGLDGYLSWNDYPHSKSHYAGHNPQNPIVLLHTPGVNEKKEHPNKKRNVEGYGENQYVIAPPVDNKWIAKLGHIDSKNIPLLRQIVKKMIEGDHKNEDKGKKENSIVPKNP